MRSFAPMWNHRHRKNGTSTPPANHSRRSAAERPDTPAATAAQAGVFSPSWYQFLAIGGALDIVDDLIGGTLGLAAQDGTGARRAGAVG